MSNSIDTRVVEMQFNNAEFERKVQSTLKSLETLNKGLKLEGAHKGLSNLSATASKFSLGNIASGVQTIASRFTTMGVIGTAALASVAAQAAQTGLALAKSLTVKPLQAGLQEYETNLNSVQTILANTGLEGQKGLDKVNTALSLLNTYSDKTIYNFSQMARNIGTFTAAGVDLDTSTAAIKGIANLAAISGSNAEQASTAMYQLSQAMAAGKATLVDWNSVVNAGMGGKVFQEALKETARVQGVNVDAIIKKNGSFRDSLQEGWLTTKVLTATLSKFTGDMTADQLKSLGYTQQQIAEILKMGKTAQDAATKVKTVSQLISTLREAAGSGWSKTFQILFGDFGEAKTLFTGLSNTLGGFIQRSADARNKVLGDWKALGGRTVLIEGIGLAFKNLLAFLTPIKQAFRDVFPPATGKSLFALTVQFRDFMKSIKPGQETLENLRRTFRGVFAIFSIGISIVKGIASAIGAFFGSISDGSGGFLEFTGSIGDWLVALDQAIKKGEGFKNFFVGLGKVLAAPVVFLKILVGLIKDININAGSLDFSSLGNIAERFAPLGRIGGAVSKAWSGVAGILGRVMDVFGGLVDKFTEFFSGFGSAVESGLTDVDYSGVLDGINTGLFAGLVLLFRKFFKNGLNLDLGGGFLGSLRESFEGVTGVMKAMQTQLKANALLKIAGAIALLTVSIVALSLIDSKKLASALTGLGVMFTQLLVAMGIMDKIASSTGFLKMPVLTASMIALAIAIDLLAVAVFTISKLDWNELAKGLTGVAVLLASLSLFTKFSTANATSGAGIILLALGINILVQAVKSFSDISWGDMAKGLIGIGALLGALALFTKLSAANAGGVLQGAGLLLLAVAINILAKAMDDLGSLSWEQIAKGLVTMAGGLGIMAAALALIPPSSVLSGAAILVTAASLKLISDAIGRMGNFSWSQIAKGLTSLAGALGLIATALALLPPTTLFSAAAIFVVAASLGMIATALGTMGGMSWEEIAKGLVTLAGSLGIIAAALIFMTGTLAGSAALLVAAAALRILTPVLTTLGSMSLVEIGKSLLALAGAFVVLGAAGLILAPITPILLALGVAIALMGVGMAAAGAGVFLFSLALTALAVSGAAAIGVVIAAIRAVLKVLPEIATALGAFIVAFAKAITKAAPAVVQAIVTVLLSLLGAIDKLSPRIIATLGNLLLRMLNAMVKYVPQMTSAGLRILVGFLNGIAQNIGKVVQAATAVIVNFLNGISASLPQITQAGVNLVITFINSVSEAIRNNSSAMGAAGAGLGLAIVEGMARGIAGGAGAVASAAKDAAGAALGAAKSLLGIKSPSKEFEKIGKQVIAGFVRGIDGNKSQIDAAFKSLTTGLSMMQKAQLSRIDQLEKKLKQLRSAELADAIAIKKTAAAIAQARKESAAIGRAYAFVTKSLGDEHTALGKLATRYDVLSNKLAAARAKVNDLTKARDEFKKSVLDQFSDLPTPGDDQSAEEFVAAGKKQLADTKRFTQLIMALRGKGLNEELFRDLLSKGVSALPFLESLTAGGKSAIDEVNKIEKDLNTAGGTLANSASSSLYNAGISAAVGLVKGLESQQKNLEKLMDKLAASMVKSIKKALGIKSPSKVFGQIGRQSVEGMAKGLDTYSILVSKSAENLGQEAVTSLQKSISKISDVLITDSDFNPVVRPVLDLTDVKKGLPQVEDMIKKLPIQVVTSATRAKDASSGLNANKAAEQIAEMQRQADISFVQNNYSPKTLSRAEIYRQTKNQLSVAKGALTP